MKYISFLSILVVIVLVGCGTKTISIDFEDLSSVTAGNPPTPVTPGAEYKVNDVLIEGKSGALIYVLPFYHTLTTGTDEGIVVVVKSNKAGGSGNELQLTSACLGIVSPTIGNDKKIKKITLNYWKSGGNINLIEGSKLGKLYVEKDFTLLPSPLPDGVKVTATSPNSGTLELLGDMSSFLYSFYMTRTNPAPPKPNQITFAALPYIAVVGGASELWIDDIKIEFDQ